MSKQSSQFLVTQLAERRLPALVSQWGVARHAPFALRPHAAGEDQAEFVFDILGDAAADLHFPLLTVHVDDAAWHRSGPTFGKFLEPALDVRHEAVGVGAIHDPMIERE
jgi:hypothetical protein